MWEIFILSFSLEYIELCIFMLSYLQTLTCSSNIFYIFIQIDSHVKRLDEDLTNFAEDLKQGMVHASWAIQFLLFLFLKVFYDLDGN